MSASTVWKNTSGASLVEFTVVLPLLLLVTLGTVDGAYMFFDMAAASNATYVGAHRATVIDPVAHELKSPTWTISNIGNQCADITAGSPTAGTNQNCPVQAATCTYSGTAGSCGAMTFDATRFNDIVAAMQTVFGCDMGNTASCALQRKNVVVSYATNELGFVGNPQGSSVNVTVSLRCLVHPFFFLGGLMRWSFSPDTTNNCTGPVTGWTMPSYATTLSSEDLASDTLH